MGKDNLQKHLDNSMYGTPQLKPEEQQKYMGTFRERCYLVMTIAQMKKSENRSNFSKELTQHPEATVLLNGAMDVALQAAYIKLINENHFKFTVVNTHVTNAPEALGLVLTAKEAVNEAVIDVEEKYTKQSTIPEEKKSNKKRFWQNLFH